MQIIFRWELTALTEDFHRTQNEAKYTDDDHRHIECKTMIGKEIYDNQDNRKHIKQKYLVSKANTQNRDIPTLEQQSETYSCKIKIVSKTYHH